MDNERLKRIAYQCILDLATDEGINASGKDEIYGCIFGRDSAITILKTLRVCASANPELDTTQLFAICRRSLRTLTALQGTTVNIESGEEPGKFIHEFRRERHEHLTMSANPWYLYDDNTMRNYDSIDSTPLNLIAIHRYWSITGDETFVADMIPAVEKGLTWMLTYADKDHDGLAEYEFHSARRHGGLLVQSWTDSHESIMNVEGRMPKYPIAPVEVQGYMWYALRLWSSFFSAGPKPFRNIIFAELLANRAKVMKKRFNDTFIFKDSGLAFAAQALDGDKNQLKTLTGNPLLLLWASDITGRGAECILDESHVRDIVVRAFMDDMFDDDAGIRTMSTLSATYNPNQDSYHNGSFWPKLNGMSYEGLMKYGFLTEAARLKMASLKPLMYFGSPIELYIKTHDGAYAEYRNSGGQVSCRQQAWSAAAALDMLVS